MSLFDANSLLEQRHVPEIDTKYHLVPAGEYPGQIADMRLREGQSDKVAVTWCNLDVIWDIIDDNIKAQLNMNRVQVTQQISFVDLATNGSGEIVTPVQLDWSTNKNVRLKRLIDATGVRKSNFALVDLKHQTAWLKVDHEPDRQGATNADGTPALYARVTRVAPMPSRR